MKGVLTILRTLGDTVLINTLVRNIKIRYPELELTVLVGHEYREIVEGNPGVKSLVSLQSWDDCLREMACNGYQKVFCPYQVTREDNLWHQIEKYRHQHLVDFYAQRCGIELKERKLLVFPKFMEGDPIPDEGTIAVHTMTLVQSKNWVGMGELICRLKAKGARIVQIGLAGDHGVESHVDLRGKLSLRQVMGYLSRCKAFVGLDSGISYLAAAVGIPTYVILGPTVPITSSPYGENVVHLLSPTRTECEVIRCHGNCRYAEQEPNGSCVNRLQVSDVMSQIGDKLCVS